MVGDGPVDIVFVPGFVSHVEIGGSLLPFRRVWERLAAFSRLVVFDKCGTGLSEHTETVPTLEQRMDDVRAVMDAAECERAAVVAQSEGGPMGCSSRLEVLQAVAFQDAPVDESTRLLLGRAQRNAATPARAVAAVRFGLECDVRDVLPVISAPTLVLHRTGDPFVPVDSGRYLADRIRDAKYVERPGEFRLSATGRDYEMIDEIEECITGRRHVPTFDRVLTTVLFTDIVGSTERAAQVKDQRWTEVLDAHNAGVRPELARFEGQEVVTAGDGLLAASDGPTRAIRCAQAVAARSRSIGIDVRAGLHSGECEVRDEGYAGKTLHIGSRVGAIAGPGEVLVTSTAGDLVIGSGFEFEDAARTY
ncbi:MAG: adenylate/guanylate cyclase domain-containing protein [Acidimicrobiales bacterium]